MPMHRTLPLAGVAAALAATALSAPALPLENDPLANPNPAGCFATMQHDWNAHLAGASGSQDEIPVIEQDARGFEDCFRQEADPVQRRSALVGAEFAHVRLTLLHLGSGDRARAQMHFETSYFILEQAANQLYSQPPLTEDRLEI